MYDSFNTYTWDAYGKMSSVCPGTSAAVCGTSGTCVTYDASGHAVEKNVSGAYSEILYSPMGETAIMSGASTVTQSYISLPGGMSMTTTGTGGTGQQQMEHHDWLGTARLSTLLSNRTVVYDRAFAPYGENYANFGATSSLNFTGDRQDLFAGLFDTPNREQMPNQGRWISPDPAGQGWNLYAYPTNPNSSVDPSGLVSYSYSLGDLNGCGAMAVSCGVMGMWGEAGVDLWNDELPQKLQQYAQIQNQTQSQAQTPGESSDCGFFCRVGQRFSNAWNGLGFRTDQQLEDTLHADTQWLRDRGINPERMTEKQIIDVHDALVTASRSGRHSVTVDDMVFIIGMIGAGGVQIDSKTLWKSGNARIDVKNPAPGERPGQIHYQETPGNVPHKYNFETGEFDGLSNTQNRNLLENPDVQNAIQKGYKYLGIGQPEVLE